jgi:hypothetical protein
MDFAGVPQVLANQNLGAATEIQVHRNYSSASRPHNLQQMYGMLKTATGTEATVGSGRGGDANLQSLFQSTVTGDQTGMAAEKTILPPHQN